jgi:ATP-dependent Clp protease ATP-binding subunit ClpX
VLFICGGAFDGLEKIVEERVGKRSIGFGAEGAISSADRAKIIEKLMPEDLLKFGLIPEFIGRLPVVATLEPLDRTALMRILTEPRNAVVKQHQKMMAVDGVDLEFERDALDAIADEALKRSTGARALRTIIEEIMLDVMFEIPSLKYVKKCVVTGATVRERQRPLLLTANGEPYETMDQTQEPAA